MKKDKSNADPKTRARHIDMAETNKTDWRTVVQQRWPNIPSSVISGSGEFALFIKMRRV